MTDAMARAAYIRALRSLRVRYYRPGVLKLFIEGALGVLKDKYRLILRADIELVRLSLEVQEPLLQIHIKLVQMTSNSRSNIVYFNH